MKPLDEHPDLAQGVRVLRIVVGAMTAGLALFLGVIAFLHYGLGQDAPPEGAGLLTSIALAVAGVLVFGAGALRMAMVRKAQAAWTEGNPRSFREQYAAAVLVAAAVVEGAGFLLGTAFLIEKDVMTLTAGVLCLLVLGAALPSRGKVNTLLEMTH